MTSTLRLPAAVIFSTTFFMSQGARNCPFLTLTARPVCAAATRRSVCRHKNAGICRTSTACATCAHCAASCTSVSTGTPSVSRISAKIGSAWSSPMPRALLLLVRLALSNDDLVDEADAEPRRQLLERGGHLQRMRPALQRAGPGDQRQRQRVAEPCLTHGDRRRLERGRPWFLSARSRSAADHAVRRGPRSTGGVRHGLEGDGLEGDGCSQRRLRSDDDAFWSVDKLGFGRRQDRPDSAHVPDRKAHRRKPGAAGLHRAARRRSGLGTPQGSRPRSCRAALSWRCWWGRCPPTPVRPRPHRPTGKPDARQASAQPAPRPRCQPRCCRGSETPGSRNSPGSAAGRPRSRPRARRRRARTRPRMRP